MIPKALEALLIGTTELFRDPAVFEQLEHEIVPRLVQRTSRPRVWSAGCSDGAELYSVAMLLGKARALDGSRLLGSDCRMEAIDRAKRGIYEPRSMPPGCRDFWRPFAEGQIAVSPALREAVRWELGDLMAPADAGPWDLILCRNVAIYLEPVAADALWIHLVKLLAPGGILVVGKAEKPRVCRLQRLAHSIYRKCTRTHANP